MIPPAIRLLIAGFTASVLFLADTAIAADAPGAKGPSETTFVLQILVLLVVGRLMGEAMLRLRQPAVMGQLMAGLLIGPSVLGALFPDLQQALFPPAKEQKAMIDAISQFGVLLLLLLTGMETDLKLVKQTGRASFCASAFGILVPFACGVALGEWLPDAMLPDPNKRLITSLFLGTALSIASVKIVAMVVREMNFMRRVVGQVILASAIIDDSVGWIIVSIIFSLALHGSIDPASLAQSVIGTIVFMALSLTVGRRVVFTIIRWVNDHFVSEFAVITVILIIMGAMSLITHYIGVHSVLGAFVAGILVGESPILTKHIDEQLRGLITAFFMPVFFGMAGLTADLTVLKDPQLLLFTIGLIAIASLGKFGGAFIGAEIGGLTRREGFALACGMNARGSTEVIIATVGLSMGALTQNLFTMIVAMAVITTLAMPPTLRWALSRIPMRKDEKKRLEREELDEKGFIPHLERLLVAVDESANGIFASRVAGMIAGTRGMPATVMQMKTAGVAKKPQAKSEARASDEQEVEEIETKKKVDEPEVKEPEKVESEAEANVQQLKEGADAVQRQEKEDGKAATPAEIVTTVHEKFEPEVIAEEAKKGYDLLVLGLDEMTSRGKDFHPNITSIVAGFSGPLALVDARFDHRESPSSEELNILVPVNGTEVSRRAAEIAITMARATKSPVTALYVAARPEKGKKVRRRSIRARREEEAILKDIVKLGESYKCDVRTAVRANLAPDDAILKEAAKRKQNIIVMGVSRRPGEKLFFGDTATSLIEKSASSLVLIAT